MADNFMTFEDALATVFKAACMARATGARQNGVFDDPELKKLGPLDIGEGTDILRIMRPAADIYHDLRIALDVVEDYIVNHCADDSDPRHGVDVCPHGREYIDENDDFCGACEFYNDCELPAGNNNT